MKRIFCIFVTLFSLFALCSCKNEPPESDSPESTEQEYASFFCTKESVDEFVAIAESLQGEGKLSVLGITEENLYNVTPPQVSAMTNVKIFKDSDSCASFILIDGEIYPICEYFGGYGFVNAVPCDLDNDGNLELLVASSWGSGLHRSIVSIFDIETKESIVIYNTATTDNPKIDLFVATVSPSLSSQESSKLPVYYQIYSAKIKVNDHNLAKLSYVATDTIGSVEYENDTFIFKPVNK